MTMTKLKFAFEYGTSGWALAVVLGLPTPALPALDDCREVDHVTLETREANDCGEVEPKVQS